jgi:hypothetical protein
MLKNQPDKAFASYAAAEDAFTAEGGHLDHRREPNPGPPDACGAERTALMAQFAIRYNGSHYSCNGIRYTHLADAVNQARLVKAREADRVRQRDPSSRPAEDPPDEAERKTMAELAIGFKDGVYSFAGFDYHYLSDAVHFATLRHSTDDGEHPR